MAIRAPAEGLATLIDPNIGVIDAPADNGPFERPPASREMRNAAR
jgi:hypothetical protein